MSSDAESRPQRLLELALAGDADSLGHLLGLYRNYFKLLARKEIDQQLRGKVDPSDVVQDVFLYVHRSFRSFRGRTEAELLSWLQRILASMLADIARRFQFAQSRDVQLERSLGEDIDNTSQMIEALAASASSPSHAASRQERAAFVADALARLPDSHREVIVLRHLQELSFSEIGQRMGRSENGARKLWMRGLLALQRSVRGMKDDSIS